MTSTLVSAISRAIQARKNCQESNNTEWFDKWSERINQFVKLLPSGAGIDHGTSIDVDASHASKIVLYADFHHMNENGFYDGWTSHKIIVTPAFSGINLRITGRNRNDILSYLYQTYEYTLTRAVELSADGKYTIIR
ncbi:MAG TPA: hypothetical protein VFR24_00095 [Candidatus Angelobacter sp.]|nr:hypothetical protein [Candidatus Angelobacter sp.]